MEGMKCEGFTKLVQGFFADFFALHPPLRRQILGEKRGFLRVDVW